MYLDFCTQYMLSPLAENSKTQFIVLVWHKDQKTHKLVSSTLLQSVFFFLSCVGQHRIYPRQPGTKADVQSRFVLSLIGNWPLEWQGSMIFNSSRCTKPGCGTLGVMSLDPFSDSDHKVQFYFCAIEIFFYIFFDIAQWKLLVLVNGK